MAKRSDDDFDVDEPEDEFKDSAADDDSEAGDDAARDQGDEQESETEQDEPLEPDHQDSVAALQEIGARLEVDKTGHVWRLFFYEKNTDEHLSNVHGLTGLKEIWLIGSRVTPKGVEAFKEKYPKVTVYY